MSIVYLGKRPANTYGNRAKRVRADPAPVYLGTRASAPRVAPVVAVPRGVRYPAPLRTGGFYGASVRSPMEKKVVDTAVANYAVNSTGVVTLINGEWITESKSLYFTHPNLRRGQWDGFHRPHWTSYQCCVCSGSRLLHPGLHDSALPTANGTSDDHRRSPDQWGHCNSCGHPPSCHCLILHESEQSRPLPRAARGNYDCWLVQQRGNTQSYAAGNQIVPINIYAKCNIPVCF